MRVLCRHGHFAFYPRDAADISQFANYFEVELVPEEDYYTFPRLQGAPDYSLQGKPYQTFPALRTFEGKPWDVLKENGWVYQIETELLVPKEAINAQIELPITGFYFTAASPLLQPGCVDQTGQRILSYSGEWNQKKAELRITEFSYE